MAVLNTVLHSSLTKSRKKLIFASLQSHVLMAWAFATKRVETEDGGRNITNPITLGRNPNVTSTEYYNTLPVAQTDEFNTLEYGWSRVVGTVIISDQEQDENTGDSMIFKLLKAKLEILEESIKRKFSEYLYGAGAGTDPLGLEALVPLDPTVGTIGGLSRSEVQLRTSSYDFGGTLDSTTIEEAMDDVFLDLTQNQDKPDIVIAGRTFIRTYRAAIRDKLVVNLADLKKPGASGLNDLGFGGVAHNDVPIVYDEFCPSNRAYFINSKYLRLHLLKGVNMKIKELSSPWNVDAIGKRIQWQGQWCMWKMFRTHAVLVM